jgi:probable phosphoglycerate mutase
MRDYGQPFYFLRHGVTDHNQARLVMGQRDIPLNRRGRDQARRAARLVAELGIAAIVSSPLSRAAETARIVAFQVGVDVTVLDGLKERCWGVLEGHGHWEKPWLHTPEGGESLEEFAGRVLSGLGHLSDCPAPVLVVAHSGICRVLRRHLDIDDGEGPVPHGIPLRFEPGAGGQWREVPLAQLSRPIRSSKS